MSLRPTQRSRTSVPASATGTVVSSSPLRPLKMAALAPMPRASDRTTTAVQPLACASVRIPCRRSLSMQCSSSSDGGTGGIVGFYPRLVEMRVLDRLAHLAAFGILSCLRRGQEVAVGGVQAAVARLDDRRVVIFTPLVPIG